MLLLLTNTRSHMGFRLVPKSVTFVDLKLRNGNYIVDTQQINHGRAVLLIVEELLVTV